MNSYFIFGDLNTADYGIVVSAVDRYSLPVRSYTEHQIIGRNGNIYTDNGRYHNVEITYHCSLDSASVLGFGPAFAAFRKHLAMLTGYQDLVDSYEPDRVRRGILVATVTPKNSGPAWVIGNFDITFSCEPQVYTERGLTKQPIGSVVMGAIAYCDNGKVPESSSSSTLFTSDSYCRSCGISVSGGDGIALRISDETFSGQSFEAVNIYVAQYSSSGVKQSDLVETPEWVRVPKGETVLFKLANTTRMIRLCWFGNTLKTVDEALQRYVTLVTSDRSYHFGTGRIYFDFLGQFDTQPVLYWWSYGSKSAAKIVMDNVTVRIGARTSIDKVLCDCEQEIFTDPDGNSLDSVCGVFSDYACQKASAVFPSLHPGLNMLALNWDTTVYDPLYHFYIMTREWEL